MQIDCEQVAARIETFMRAQVEHFCRDGVVLGMSGGLDSAVVGTLAVRALGPDQVLALLLPERDSSPDSGRDALKVIQALGIEHRTIDLTQLLSAVGIYSLLPLRFLGLRQIQAAVVQQAHRRTMAALHEQPFRAGLLGTRQVNAHRAELDAGNAYSRAKHRARLLTLYYVADLENRLVLGTTNKSESLTGFVVKWGDNVADIEPILPLYKTQVRQLAAYLGVHPDIIAKAPSPDLLPGIVDEFALGITYEALDQVLVGLEQGWPVAQVAAQCGVAAAQVEHVAEMWRRSQHLRALPPTPQL